MKNLFGCAFIFTFSTVGISGSLKVFDDPSIITLEEDNGKSYFGYDLEWILEKDQEVSLFIGAPKTPGGGALYKCRVNLDTSFKECKDISPSLSEILEEYDQQLLGLTVSVETNGRVLWTCAPSFHRIYEKEWEGGLKSNYSAMLGHCFVYEGKHGSPRRVVPLNHAKMFFGRKYFPTGYSYGAIYGQAGMSVHHVDDRAFLGAPGVWNWTGSIVAIDKEHPEHSVLTQPWNQWDDGLKTFIGPRLSDYAGYSINSGYFSKMHPESLIVVGAPRHGEQRAGSVFIERYSPGNPDVESLYKIDGTQMGEYFGASLACLDLNGDGLDEVVVGSPLFSFAAINRRSKRDASNIKLSYDLGRISIYYFDNNINQFALGLIVNGALERGRFGLSLLNTGDLNGDECEDLLVGSPYEDHGRGALRLYYGDREGFIRREPIQVIRARSISDKLFAFGISIAKALDIDGNGIKDIAIGASGRRGKIGSAVILRGSPSGIIQLDSESSVDSIDLSSSSKGFTISVCVTLKSEKKSELEYFTKVRIHVFGADLKDRRFAFADSSQRWSSEILTLKRDVPHCVTHINVHPVVDLSPTSYELPLSFIISANSDGIHSFCSLCTLTEKVEQYLEVPFMIDCLVDDGGNIVCRNDLRISAMIKESIISHGDLILGPLRKIHLEIDISNSPDSSPAFQPMCNVTFPPHTFPSVYTLRCQTLKEERKMVCKIPGPILPGGNVIFPLEFDIQNLIGEPQESTKILTFSDITVYNKNIRTQEIDFSDNKVDHTIELKIEADLEITALSNGKFLNYTTYVNTFRIRNLGVSPVSRVTTDFFIPKSLTNSGTIIESFSISLRPFGSTKSPCNAMGQFINKETVSTNGSISCSNLDVRCIRVICPQFSLIDGSMDVIAKLVFNPDIHVQENFQSTVVIEGRVFPGAVGETVDKASNIALLEIDFLNLRLKKVTAPWTWIVLSILIGLLVYIIIVISLWKSGILKKRKPEDLYEKELPE